MGRLGNRRDNQRGVRTFVPAKLENPVHPRKPPAAPVHAPPRVTLKDDADRRNDRPGGRIDFD
jgi:hypothetical protein